MTLAVAFALTVVIEGLIAAAVLRRWVWWDDLLVQLTTWPLAIALSLLANTASALLGEWVL
jgi:hypothetical protein